MEGNDGDATAHESHRRASELTVGQRIRQARSRAKQRQVARAMIEIGDRYLGAASLDALVKMISKWEHDKIIPDQYNRQLLALALEVTVADLGLELDPCQALEPSASPIGPRRQVGLASTVNAPM